jgi:hypothetical protein
MTEAKELPDVPRVGAERGAGAAAPLRDAGHRTLDLLTAGVFA